MGKLETPVYIVIILQLQHTFGENEIVEFIFSCNVCDKWPDRTSGPTKNSHLFTF
jgi:hypothetical protein